MKKRIVVKHFLFFVIACSFTSIVTAQDEVQSKKERKAKSSFKIYAGVNLNGLNIDTSTDLKSDGTMGYDLGFSYKRGRFFYYEIGARLNRRSFDITDAFDTSQTSNFAVSALDVPVTFGLNLTSYVDRLIGVRLFVSGIPSFTIGSKFDDKIGIDKDDIQDFIFYGQGGIGFDITVIFVELGINYGFNDIIKDTNGERVKSNPAQGFLNLGFRF